MQQALAYSLPLALTIALSPLPPALSISVLLSSQPKNAILALTGWSAGILSIGFVVFFIPGLDSERGSPSRLAGLLRLVMGTGLMFLAIRMWLLHMKSDGVIEESRLLSRLENSTPGKILGTGFTLSALNPKNLLLTFAGASYIDTYAATLSEQSLALLVFTLVASLSVGAPILGYNLFSENAERVLGNFQDWLIRNNHAVVGTLLLVIGVVVAINGLSILLSFH